MQIKNAAVVVTGGASGIGAALCRRFAREGARGIVVADLDACGAREVADEVKGVGMACDVAVESQIADVVATAERAFGPVDLFCSNAGIVTMGGIDATDEQWKRIYDVNFMSHIYAARAVVPGMLKRGRGYLLQTASAAGLLTQIGSAPYAVTKHAAVALAEWLAITYGERGIGVSCLCPLGVRTDMCSGENPFTKFLLETAIDAEDVAEAVVQGLADERFLILPHPVVAEYFRRKANDYDRWLRGMRRLQRNLLGEL
jgi:NAD(P)-dependent dehydrogenase (short-subunit alcohol dehydrogenase family)